MKYFSHCKDRAVQHFLIQSLASQYDNVSVDLLYTPIGAPLIIHVTVGLGKPFTLQSNSAVSSTEAMTSLGLSSRQNGVAT